MTEWVGAIVGAVGSLANGGWALRLESKVAEIQADRAGDVKLNDERHLDNKEALRIINQKLDVLLDRR